MTRDPFLETKTLSSGLVEVSGTSHQLMKLRAELARLDLQNEIMTSASGSLLLTGEGLVRLRAVGGLGLDSSNLLSAELQHRENLFESHQSALERMRAGLASSLGRSTSPYWSAILKPYQIDAVEAMKVEGLLGFCLLDEQGTGKTLTTVAAFDELVEAEQIDKLLVVCPKTLVGTWEKEFRDFLPDKYDLIRIEGSKSARYAALRSSGEVFLTSYESASLDVVEMRALMQTGRFLAVFDESFFVKNESARRSQSAGKIRELASKAFVLCGTPAPNSPEDLINQFDLADLGFTFLGYNSTGIREKDSENIAERLRARGAFVRRIKEDVLAELPTKQFEIVECVMTDGQRLLYEEARSELELYLRRIDNTVFRRSLATYFQKRSALLQICVAPDLVGYRDQKSGKDDSLIELVQNILSDPGRKVVIWSSFTRSIDHICEMFFGYGVARLDGTVTDPKARQAAIWAFQNKPDCRVFVGNPAAAGAGITLTAASDSIYVSYPNQAAFFMQSLDRIHRLGQTSTSVNFYLLVSRGTLEEHVVKRLAEKQSTQSLLLGDTIDPGVTLVQALEELGAYR